MGVDTRRPILPAPTESIVDTTGGSATATDLATDISRRTDKSSYSIPDDGSPVTISTHRKHRPRAEDSKLSHSSHHSQTSLLIEYFEGGKGSGALVSRPSVRVRVTPSAGRKHKEHVQITDSSGKKSYSRRISFSSPSKQKSQGEHAGDDQSTSSSIGTDENQQSSSRPPVEIELMNRDHTSELSTLSRDARYIHPTSDISSMPADSLLEASSSGPRRKRSQSLEREQTQDSKVYLKTPSRQRSRSLSTERIAHRVAEKLSNDPREVATSKDPQSEKYKGDPQQADPKSPRRRLFREEDMSPESSLLSASAVSSRRRSGDQYSIRSGTSKSSINNPKLLETVEDAIRRLILPELKELKKDQKVISNTSKFERDMNASYSSTSSPKDELGRRLSKHASAPNVRKPKVVLNKDSRDEGIVLSGESVPSQQERRPSKDTDTTSDGSYVKWAQRPELSEQDKLRRQRSKGLRDAEKAAIVGSALTAAALKHHDSRSSIDKNEGRKASGSRSRAGSINETELVFRKHNVAPMPFRSAIESDITRGSLLSEQTAEPTSPRFDSKTQDTTHGSPRQLASPTSRTPTRTPLDSRYELKHSNLSSHNLSIHSSSDHDLREKSRSPGSDASAGAIAAAAAANLLDVHSGHRGLDFNDISNRRRTLSPIQSVASNQSESHIRQDSTHQGEQGSLKDERELEPRLSIDSLSSAPSTDLARSTRDGPSFASQSEIMRHHKSGPELGYEQSPGQSPRPREWQEYSDVEGEQDYRNSMAETTSTENRRMTGYTEESDVDYMEKVNQGQPVAGIGANPQYVHPVAVESAVASLLDPSILDTKSNQSGGNRSQASEPRQLGDQSPRPMERGLQTPHGSRQGSPLKQRQDASPDATSFPRRMGATSPPQSVTQSLDDQAEPSHMFMDPLHDGSPPGGHSPDSESEINTNPSIIQGPAHESKWTYDHTPPKGAQSPLFDNANVAAGSAGMDPMEKSGYNQNYYAEDGYENDGYYDQQYPRGHMFDTPSGLRDEGYVSAANPLSPGAETPEMADKGFGGIDANGMGLFDNPAGADDQFMPSHQRQVSGYSHGIGSPLYDSATGRGIDQIQSKDIVALMDHLTVRDAQRNARDTEILVTLVRSAAEMRNSFEEMKKFIAQQDGLLMEASDKQHDRTYRALGGPRPLPASGARSVRQSTMDDGDDMRSKRKNVFKRALKGLSLKSSNDLTKIEEMLEQLLEEVEALRAGQDDRFPSNGNRGPSVDPEGYEPEGQAGTASSGAHSGYLSMYARPMPDSGAKAPGVSNSLETGEKLRPDDRGAFLSPNPTGNISSQQERAGSEPLSSPPRVPVASGALSNETTPKTNEKTRKHKSSSSSFFPKISRWSKTTASSMGDNIRHSIQPSRKDRESFDASRSGSDLAHGPYRTADYYDPQGDDRLRSNYTLEDQQQENRPPSPLVPSQVSEAPKYRAHRDSLDLQHPQPRQGPTGRYQSQLESQARIYGMPAGATYDQWGSNPSLSGANAIQGYGGSPLSPISDADMSETSSRANRQPGPPRPPKIKDDGPLIPERASKVSSNDDERSYGDRVVSRFCHERLSA
ncbi:conserved hypothetical protein [Aspergillus terreus NIH2624]|uniref:Uncharacterized protein n=1 Tax=Aspergillus terreus (strain NIH 2624 / FGSC A1156) TaxID=341663 RepID=Q0CSW9_ASPTN|nr:uncharacterized protein ATEG_03215 [Aspergillus terreus NIH2624]EAU36489.1 conserved hypothetical protein [Aspergillus terreus NIH2624]